MPDPSPHVTDQASPSLVSRIASALSFCTLRIPVLSRTGHLMPDPSRHAPDQASSSLVSRIASARIIRPTDMLSLDGAERWEA